MEHWYVLHTIPGKEQAALELLERAVDPNLCSQCQIPKKLKVFRSGGLLHLVEDVMFKGYLFIRTVDAKTLSKELDKAKKFPQFIGETKESITSVEEADLHFLQDVCGEDLKQTMGLTRIILNERNQIIRAEGILEHYQNRIVKLNLHKRYAVVNVELFNRNQPVLFGLCLEQDQAV